MKKIFLLLAVILAGCNVQKREVAKLHALNYKYPNELAADCAKWFPVKNTLGKPIFISANNADLTKKLDSLQQAADSLKAATILLNALPKDTAQVRKSVILLTNRSNALLAEVKALKQAYKPCKPDTVKQPIYIVDNALVVSLTAKLKAKSDSLISAKTSLSIKSKEASKYLWILIAIGAAVIVFLGIKVYSLFTGGAAVKAGSSLINLFKK